MINQMVYEGKLKYTDPDKYKEFMKAKAAHDDGDDNAVESNTSYQGKGTSGGVQALNVKHYSMKPKASEANDSTPVAPAPAPEPEAEAETKPATPVELSPEVAQAKERAAAYKMDGNAGSLFSTDEPQAAEAEPDAQSFADKYKLNLLNKGEGETDFSGV